MDSSTPNVSVIVPVYNEKENLSQTIEEVEQALTAPAVTYELIFVNDCSSDGSREQLNALSEQHPPVVASHLEQRSGQSAAMLKGMEIASGATIITMDGDCQNNPADIPLLLETLESCDVVCGFRAKRADSWSRRAGSRLANKVRNWITKDGIRDTGCSLKAFRSECCQDLPPLEGVHRFMPAYFMLNGRSIKEVPVDHRPRTRGNSKYTNLSRLPRTIADLFGFRWYRKRFLKNG